LTMSATTDMPMTRVGVQQPSSAAGTGRGASMIGALVLLATVQLMVVLDTTIVNVALPTIQAKVGFSTSGIAWVVNGYALTFGALLLLGGRSGDMLGRRNVFVAALGAFALASAIGGLASSPTMLIVARVVQGASAAFAQATALSLGPILAGLLALATFVGLEARSKQPLMPFWVFRDRNRGGAYLIQALLGAALFGMFFLSTLFLQHVLGYSPLKAGAAFIPLTVVMIASAGLVSKLVVHTGVRPLIATGTAIAAIGLLWLSNLTPHSSYISGAMLPLMVVGIGLGMTFVPATLSAVSGVKEEHSGLVSGV